MAKIGGKWQWYQLKSINTTNAIADIGTIWFMGERVSAGGDQFIIIVFIKGIVPIRVMRAMLVVVGGNVEQWIGKIRPLRCRAKWAEGELWELVLELQLTTRKLNIKKRIKPIARRQW